MQTRIIKDSHYLSVVRLVLIHTPLSFLLWIHSFPCPKVKHYSFNIYSNLLIIYVKKCCLLQTLLWSNCMWKHKGKKEGCVGKNTQRGSHEKKKVPESTCFGSQSKSVLFCKPSWRLKTLPLLCYFCIYLVSGVNKRRKCLSQILVATKYVKKLHFKLSLPPTSPLI